MTEQVTPLLQICGGHRYEELYRNLHHSATLCRDPESLIRDLVSLVTDSNEFNTELPMFLHAVGSGDYVEHQYYNDMGKEQQEFSKKILSDLAIDARNTAIYLYNTLKSGGYYDSKGNFPYVLQQYTSRALSLKPTY